MKRWPCFFPCTPGHSPNPINPTPGISPQSFPYSPFPPPQSSRFCLRLTPHPSRRLNLWIRNSDLLITVTTSSFLFAQNSGHTVRSQYTLFLQIMCSEDRLVSFFFFSTDSDWHIVVIMGLLEATYSFMHQIFMKHPLPTRHYLDDRAISVNTNKISAFWNLYLWIYMYVNSSWNVYYSERREILI